MEIYHCSPKVSEVVELGFILGSIKCKSQFHEDLHKLILLSRRGSIYLKVITNHDYELKNDLDGVLLLLTPEPSKDVSLIQMILLLAGLNSTNPDYKDIRNFPMEYFSLLTKFPITNHTLPDRYCMHTSVTSSIKDIIEPFLFTNTRGSNISLGTPGSTNLVLYKFDKKDKPRISTWISHPSSITRKNGCSGVEQSVTSIVLIKYWMSLLPPEEMVRGSVLVNLLELRFLFPKMEFDIPEITRKLDTLITNNQITSHGKDMSTGSSCSTSSTDRLQIKEASHSDGSIPIGNTVYGRRRRTSIEVGHLSHQTIIGDR